MKVSYRKAVFEFLSIVVAVVLAMALTEWRQQVLNRKLAESSFQNILAEVNSNHRKLSNDSAEIASHIVMLNNWLGADDKAKDTIDLDIGFSLTFLTSSAWEVAAINQSLTYLESEKVQDLADLYEAQKFYQGSGKDVFDEMSSLIMVGDRNSAEFEGQIKAYRFRLSLTYGSINTFLNVARDIERKYVTASVSKDQ